MGSPKALLDWQGTPLWRSQMAKLRELQPAELFLSLPKEIILPEGEWKILHDEQPGLGPLGGLATAASAIKTDWLVVLAIDLPLVTADFLGQLLREADRTGWGQVPELDDHYLGLAAIYPVSTLRRLRHLSSFPDRSLQKFVREAIERGEVAPRPLASQERRLFLNLNTPGDRAGGLDGDEPDSIVP
jgi:molybdopterin-guanine dinucleotide biosynthesis protein A